LTIKLKEKGYGYTSVNAQGSQGPVKLIYTIVMRKNLPEIARLIEQSYPSAFFTVEELRSVERGVFPKSSSYNPHNTFWGRKSK
ncbi:MAG: DUF2179 domain-containing protein, partial [Anaerolineales bacterium]|nr:DUF2179 domain-containing protein [Anaerolineales bacterium]